MARPMDQGCGWTGGSGSLGRCIDSSIFFNHRWVGDESLGATQQFAQRAPSSFVRISLGTTPCPSGWPAVASYGSSTSGSFTKPLRNAVCGLDRQVKETWVKLVVELLQRKMLSQSEIEKEVLPFVIEVAIRNPEPSTLNPNPKT